MQRLPSERRLPGRSFEGCGLEARAPDDAYVVSTNGATDGERNSATLGLWNEPHSRPCGLAGGSSAGERALHDSAGPDSGRLDGGLATHGRHRPCGVDFHGGWLDVSHPLVRGNGRTLHSSTIFHPRGRRCDRRRRDNAHPRGDLWLRDELFLDWSPPSGLWVEIGSVVGRCDVASKSFVFGWRVGALADPKGAMAEIPRAGSAGAPTLQGAPRPASGTP